MPKFGYLGSKSSKTNVRLDVSTFEIGYGQNFVKRLKIDTSRPKIPKYGHLDSKFEKRN